MVMNMLMMVKDLYDDVVDIANDDTMRIMIVMHSMDNVAYDLVTFNNEA